MRKVIFIFLFLIKTLEAKPPNFEYENEKGEKIRLNDFKGKYLYIDIWATWCGPCYIEFPYLRKLKKAYKNKPIKFLGISLYKEDNKKEWKKIIEKQNLGAIQLITNKNFNLEFVDFFQVNTLPKFILLDKEGTIIEKNAPKPSNEKELKKLLDSLNL